MKFKMMLLSALLNARSRSKEKDLLSKKKAAPHRESCLIHATETGVDGVHRAVQEHGEWLRLGAEQVVVLA